MSILDFPKKIDWIVHYVFEERGPGGSTNAHTHGMENYGQMDFQLVIPVVPKKATVLLNAIALEVQKGKRFVEGDYPEKTVYNTAFRLKRVRETGRIVLRIIMPDPNLRFPEDPLCEEPYKYQTEKMFEY